jgi:hypothetical protein
MTDKLMQLFDCKGWPATPNGVRETGAHAARIDVAAALRKMWD